VAKKKIVRKKKELIPGVRPDRPFPPPPKPKKRKNKTVTRNVFKCGICNEPIQTTNLPLHPREFYFCDKCTRGPFGKLGMWFVDLFIVFKSFLFGK